MKHIAIRVFFVMSMVLTSLTMPNGGSVFGITDSVAKEAKESISADMRKKIEKRLQNILGSDTDVKTYLTALDKLETAANTFKPEDVKKIIGKIRKGVETAENAGKLFDKMIEKLRETQALGDPDGEFVKLMNKSAKAARERADLAFKRGTKMSKKLAEGFMKTYEAFIAARDRAIEARNSTLPAIAFIQQNKADYVDALALREYTMMAEIADQAVTKMEAQSRAIQESAKKMKEGLLGQAEDIPQ